METSVAVVIPTAEVDPPGYVYTPAQQLWPATPRGVHLARRALVAQLDEWGLSDLAHDGGLVLSELMANAFQHGKVGGRKTGVSFFRVTAGFRIEVHDTVTERLPALTDAPETALRGRGLAIVDAVTDQNWGVAERNPGKVVWAIVLGVTELLEFAKTQRTNEVGTPVGQ